MLFYYRKNNMGLKKAINCLKITLFSYPKHEKPDTDFEMFQWEMCII